MLTPVMSVNDVGNEARADIDISPVMYESESALFDNDAINALIVYPRVDI